MPAVQISPSALEWAIQESGLSVEQLAKDMGVSKRAIEDWLEGQDYPNRTQFRQLASKLNRPPSILFLPDAPAHGSSAETFYRESIGQGESDQGAPTLKELEWIEKAQRLQGLGSEITRFLEQRPTISHRLLVENADEAAMEERQRWGLSISEQLSWASPVEAFQRWVEYVESQGVGVFRLPMGRDAVRGFAIWDEWMPIAAINTAYRWTEQRIFTLLHEYAHLTLRSDFVDARDTVFEGRSAEAWCNRFAAAMAIPAKDLDDYLRFRIGIRDRSPISNLEIVEKIASDFKVSWRAVAVRLIELDYATRDLYDLVEQQAVVKDYEQNFRRSSKKQTRPVQRVNQFGSFLNARLLSAVDQEILSPIDLADYLDVGILEIDAIRQEIAEAK